MSSRPKQGKRIPAGRTTGASVANRRPPQRGEQPNERVTQHIEDLAHPDSEDEAYGGSPASEDGTPDATPRQPRRDSEGEADEEPRRIPTMNSMTPRQSSKQKTSGGMTNMDKSSTKMSKPQGKPMGGQRRVINGKGPLGGSKSQKRTGAKSTDATSTDIDDTFGDEERKCIKEFKEAYNSFNKQLTSNEMPAEKEIEHLCALAEIYKKSALGTLNIYSMLKASGLYNLCLVKAQGTNPETYTAVKELLVAFEDMALRRVLKIKSTSCHLFQHDKKVEQHRSELKEIRDVCAADYKNILDSLKELATSKMMLDQKSASTRQIQAEDNIAAVTSLAQSEVAARIKNMLAGLLNECVEMQGEPPCKYALVGNHELGSKEITPFQPISVFLVIEKDSATAKTYFRNTIALLGLKMYNLGETSLASLNIRSLQWLNNQSSLSGFTLQNYIDDTEKKDFSTVPLDCIKTPKDLTQLAVGNKADIREALVDLLHDITFVAGDLKLFKDLLPVRTAVLQREQTEKAYKKRFFAQLKTLIANTDPLSHRSLTEESEDVVQIQSLTFLSQFMRLFAQLEKTLSAEGMINRLEEMQQIGTTAPYTSVTISSESYRGKGIISTISTRLPTPESRSPTPEPVRLPDIPIFPKPQVPRKTTWTIDEVEEVSEVSRTSPPVSQEDALKKLKELKNKRRNDYSAAVNNFIYNGGIFSAGKTESGYSELSISTGSSGHRTTWQKPQKVPKKRPPKVPEVLPTPDPVERFVYVVPVFEGKQKNILSPESARQLILLHSLTSAITLSNRSAQLQLPSKLAERFVITRKLYEDLNPDDDEFVVALSYFQNRQYALCCKAIYKYLENRSDITFIGEPYPADFTEVSDELVNDSMITEEKYVTTHLLLAYSEMRRKAYDESLSYWEILESREDNSIEKSYIHIEMAECLRRLGDIEEMKETATKAMKVFREEQKANKEVKSYEEEISRLQELLKSNS